MPRHFPSVAASKALSVLPSSARFVLRGDQETLNMAFSALTLPHSKTPCRATVSGDRATLWLGPDERLLLAPEASASDLFNKIERALENLPHSCVEISHRQIALQVQGPEARDVLNAGCPLDLDPQAFPVGMCTRTLLGKAEIVLWHRTANVFHVEVWRSFADYVSRFLAEAH